MCDFKAGDLVLLTFETGGYNNITPDLLRYKGRKFRVQSIHYVKGNDTNRWIYYILKGCKARTGIPYAIMPSWTQPMRELKR